MRQEVSIREANLHLSRYVRLVEQGEEVVITRWGRPVARLVPVTRRSALGAERLAALERSRFRMERGADLGGRMPGRDELHER